MTLRWRIFAIFFLREHAVLYLYQKQIDPSFRLKLPPRKTTSIILRPHILISDKNIWSRLHLHSFHSVCVTWHCIVWYAMWHGMLWHAVWYAVWHDMVCYVMWDGIVMYSMWNGEVCYVAWHGVVCYVACHGMICNVAWYVECFGVVYDVVYYMIWYGIWCIYACVYCV